MMKREFKVGDHVSWNSEAGRIRGTIQKKITAPTKFKTYMARASKEEPQYVVKSDATGHLAMHKGSALTKIGASRRVSQKRPARSKENDGRNKQAAASHHATRRNTRNRSLPSRPGKLTSGT